MQAANANIDYQKFIYEYILLFLFSYSFFLISVFETMYYGWWLLTITQFIMFSYFISSFYDRATEPFFYFLLIGLGLTLSALGIFVFKLQKYFQDDSSSKESKKILLIPTKKQELVKKFKDFIIADFSLLTFIFLVMKFGEPKHLSPFKLEREKEYEYCPLTFITLKEYKKILEYCIPWFSAMSQIAILGLAPYSIFLAHSF